MTFAKRTFDIVFAALLIVVLSPLMILIGATILIAEGRPVFFVSERMKSPEFAFRLVKFRTMSGARNNSGVSGNDKANRVTRTGRFMRKTRLDELPQLWNILKGDMSFVGPRPPLRQYVERFPELYARVLASRPGVTGLATLMFHRQEERLLSRCMSARETDAVYARRCVGKKARFDLIYQKNRTIFWDVRLCVATVLRSLPPVHGKRRPN